MQDLPAVAESIEPRILTIRGQRVIIDADLASMYGVKGKALNQAVKRNEDRFPEDFNFFLTREEKQEVVTNCDHLRNLRYSKNLPRAFTEHRAIMAASVLNTPRAVEMSVFVVRAFVKLRQWLGLSQELAKRLRDLEGRVGKHDEAIQLLLTALRELANPPVPEKPKRRIGFQAQSE